MHPVVQLNVLQEVLELFQIDDESSSAALQQLQPDQDHSESVVAEQVFWTLLQAAVSGTSSSHTMQFEGSIQSHKLSVLLDSDSSNTFISSELASLLLGIQPLDQPISVRVANGELILCSSHLPNAQWSLQHCNFQSDLKVIQLQHYDLIMGMDWLESHSPMKIHWKYKWVLIPYGCSFHQIHLKAGEEPKTAFQTHFGHFEFKVMSFGLYGAPGTFQGAMNVTLQPLLRRCVVVFFDDILVYSKSFEDHFFHLRQVFQLLAKDQWQVKLTKCTFAQRQIAYLGHVINQEGISTNPDKVKAIAEWPVPSNSKELRSFLGLAGYYRKFIQPFTIVAKPLTELLKNHTLFVWTESHQSAFDALKSTLCSAPVLAMPDFAQPFYIETDACGAGVGAVLWQNGHLLAYISKPLGPKSANLSMYEKEYLTIILAVDQWRSYL
ncbi:hypothetical protein U9M48_005029 [Paspalum notatum var. saurae]|uniref:Reverse transcriptase domain-containing protein n=1 Tax=Paspalum notatum var. saurae TaxID=547442 RepID=A0AAQ3PPY1_PASNO